MRERVTVNDGDWFVEHDWKYHVRQAIRITTQMIFYMGEGFNLRDGTITQEKRVRLDRVVFASPSEEAAKMVAERLTSSDALCEDERRNAALRCIERNEKIIAAANASRSQAA